MSNDEGLGAREMWSARPITEGSGSNPATLLKRDPVRPRAAPARRPRILVVDDEPDVLSTVHDLLRIDYEIVTRTRALDALELLRSETIFDVIMSDQRMPGMTGVELLKEAKAICPDTTRLLFTAYADIHAVIDAINQGHVFRYIGKPWDPPEFLAVVRQGVEQHELIVERRRLLQELQESNRRLEDANRLKGAFLEVASHELNTPVSMLLGLIELWRLSGGSGEPGRNQWIERMNQAASRLAATVERMLKLVKSGDFGPALQLAPVDLHVLAPAVVDQIAAHLEARRQTVQIELDPALGPIQADSSKLYDILLNLLANAVKFTPDQGTIRVWARREGSDHARIGVTDQGQGIAPADLPHLFEPFFTSFDTLRHSSGDFQYGKRGIGLGLWLVKAFVELHGGQVECTSTPGAGSTFSFVLPLGRPQPMATSSEAEPPFVGV